MSDPHYQEPGWFTNHVFNPTVAGLTRVGISVWGSRVLETRGEKPDVLRAYLKRWKAEVGVFFDGVGPTSADDELERIAPRQPIFRIATK